MGVGLFTGVGVTSESEKLLWNLRQEGDKTYQLMNTEAIQLESSLVELCSQKLA